jgi:hypothetical protein
MEGIKGRAGRGEWRRREDGYWDGGHKMPKMRFLHQFLFVSLRVFVVLRDILDADPVVSFPEFFRIFIVDLSNFSFLWFSPSPHLTLLCAGGFPTNYLSIHTNILVYC